MQDKEIIFETSLLEFTESQINNAIIMLPEEIEIQYKNPNFWGLSNKVKVLLNELDSSEFITTQQAIKLIEPMVKMADGKIIASATSIGIMLNQLIGFVFNSAMAKLASRGEIDASWDIENNRIDFWIPIVGE